MKKRVARWKIFSWVVALVSATLVFLWTNLPQILQSSSENLLREANANLKTITVDRFNPWALRLSGMNVLANEGNISLQQLDARYDPVSLTKGKVHSVSLSSPDIKIDLPKLLERVNTIQTDEEGDKTFQSKVEEFLSNPPLQHFRMRNGSISLASDEHILATKLALVGDFHKGLTQLRMDGDLSGLPWLGDLTIVQDSTDLFLGASLNFPDLSFVSSSMSAISKILDLGDIVHLNDWIEIDQGSAKGQWTGRVEEDGIMDQFMDFNVSNLILEAMGLSFNIPQAILFITPHTPNWMESNFYANVNWGENLELNGLKISVNLKDGKPNLTLRAQRLRTRGVLPKTEILGLIIDGIEFAYSEDGEFLGIREAKLRFSALHLEEGLFNLYDGELSLEWLGEDRFLVKLHKANGSLPTLGLNLHNFAYAGEIDLDSIPKLESEQIMSVEEAFLGEDQKIEDLQVKFKVDSIERIELTVVEAMVNGFGFSFKPANLIIEMPESTQGRVDLSSIDSELQFSEPEDFSFRNITGNIKFNSIDPLDSNGTQSIRFDLHAGEQVLQGGEIRFELLPTGEKIIETVEIPAFGGLVSLEETRIDESFDDLSLHAIAKGLDSQKLISLFEDLDARMEGNLSGVLNIRNDSIAGWDFYGGSLSLDSSESAKLFLNTHGMLTDGLVPESSEYKNMYLLERALKSLNLEALNIIFRVMDDGERIIEMNVRGDSDVDGKEISVEYRPKIIGGLEALMQQANLRSWGITPSK